MTNILNQLISEGGLEEGSPVVFDIDGTLVTEGEQEPAMKRVYDHVVGLGCEIHFITARENRHRSATEKLLQQHGFGTYTEMWCMPSHQPLTYDVGGSVTPRNRMTVTVPDFKHITRQSIANHHKKGIALTVGNEWFDHCKRHHFNGMDSVYMLARCPCTQAMMLKVPSVQRGFSHRSDYTALLTSSPRPRPPMESICNQLFHCDLLKKDDIVVMDIDGTVITNNQPEYMLKYLYDYMVGIGCRIHFVTARTSDAEEYTETQLREHGFHTYQKLWMLDPPLRTGYNYCGDIWGGHHHLAYVQTFKEKTRKALGKITLTVGNEWYDHCRKNHFNGRDSTYMLERCPCTATLMLKVPTYLSSPIHRSRKASRKMVRDYLDSCYRKHAYVPATE